MSLYQRTQTQIIENTPNSLCVHLINIYTAGTIRGGKMP